MPDLGIGETIAALGGADIFGDIGLGSLFGAGAAGAGGPGALSGAGAADLLAPSGAGLFGGTTGLVGTDLAAGAGTDLGALTATSGLGVAGTAADFLAAPGASGFNPAALTPGIGDPGGGPGVLNPIPATPTGVGGTDVFGPPPGTPGLRQSPHRPGQPDPQPVGRVWAGRSQGDQQRIQTDPAGPGRRRHRVARRVPTAH